MIEECRFRAQTGTEFPYLLYTPDEPLRTGERLPMIFYLHGAGSRGDDLSILVRNGLPRMILQGEFSHRCIVAAPQCPEDMVWFYYIRELKELAETVLQRTGADPDRLSLTGLSMGGFGCWELGMYAPELFSAMAPLCGGGMAWRSERLRDVPIRAFHGALDTSVLPEYSRIMVDAVNAAGGTATLTIFPEDAHNCWDDAYGTCDTIEWLLSQKKRR